MCQSFWHMTVTVKNQLNLFTTYVISLIFTTLLKDDGHEEKEAQPHHSPPEKRDRDYRLESREETERREWFLTRRWRGSRRNAYKYIDGYKYKYNKNTRYKQYHDQLSHQKLVITNLARRRGVPNLVSANMSATMGATAMACSTQGWAGIPVSRDSWGYKPQISLPFPWHYKFPSPFLEKR